MNVKMANHNDIDTLIKVRFDYFAAENWELTNEKRHLIRSQLQQYCPKHLNHDFFAAFIKDEDGNVLSVAFIVILEKPANLSFPTGKTGMILNVLTYPKFRGKGYATQVLNLLIDKAKEEDVSFIELSASELGKPLYEKLGFKKLESHFTEMRLSLLKS